MRDILGKELEVGDKVAYADSRYADLNHGVVLGFTPKMVKISDRGYHTLKTSSQVAIVEKFNA